MYNKTISAPSQTEPIPEHAEVERFRKLGILDASVRSRVERVLNTLSLGHVTEENALTYIGKLIEVCYKEPPLSLFNAKLSYSEVLFLKKAIALHCLKNKKTVSRSKEWIDFSDKDPLEFPWKEALEWAHTTKSKILQTLLTELDSHDRIIDDLIVKFLEKSQIELANKLALLFKTTALATVFVQYRRELYKSSPNEWDSVYTHWKGVMGIALKHTNLDAVVPSEDKFLRRELECVLVEIGDEEESGGKRNIEQDSDCRLELLTRVCECIFEICLPTARFQTFYTMTVKLCSPDIPLSFLKKTELEEALKCTQFSLQDETALKAKGYKQPFTILDAIAYHMVSKNQEVSDLWTPLLKRLPSDAWSRIVATPVLCRRDSAATPFGEILFRFCSIHVGIRWVIFTSKPQALKSLLSSCGVIKVIHRSSDPLELKWGSYCKWVTRCFTYLSTVDELAGVFSLETLGNAVKHRYFLRFLEENHAFISLFLDVAEFYKLPCSSEITQILEKWLSNEGLRPLIEQHPLLYGFACQPDFLLRLWPQATPEIKVILKKALDVRQPFDPKPWTQKFSREFEVRIELYAYMMPPDNLCALCETLDFPESRLVFLHGKTWAGSDIPRAVFTRKVAFAEEVHARQLYEHSERECRVLLKEMGGLRTELHTRITELNKNCDALRVKLGAFKHAFEHDCLERTDYQAVLETLEAFEEQLDGLNLLFVATPDLPREGSESQLLVYKATLATLKHNLEDAREKEALCAQMYRDLNVKLREFKPDVKRAEQECIAVAAFRERLDSIHCTLRFSESGPVVTTDRPISVFLLIKYLPECLSADDRVRLCCYLEKSKLPDWSLPADVVNTLLGQLPPLRKPYLQSCKGYLDGLSKTVSDYVVESPIYKATQDLRLLQERGKRLQAIVVALKASHGCFCNIFECPFPEVQLEPDIKALNGLLLAQVAIPPDSAAYQKAQAHSRQQWAFAEACLQRYITRLSEKLSPLYFRCFGRFSISLIESLKRLHQVSLELAKEEPSTLSCMQGFAHVVETAVQEQVGMRGHELAMRGSATEEGVVSVPMAIPVSVGTGREADDGLGTSVDSSGSIAEASEKPVEANTPLWRAHLMAVVARLASVLSPEERATLAADPLYHPLVVSFDAISHFLSSGEPLDLNVFPVLTLGYVPVHRLRIMFSQCTLQTEHPLFEFAMRGLCLAVSDHATMLAMRDPFFHNSSLFVASLPCFKHFRNELAHLSSIAIAPNMGFLTEMHDMLKVILPPEPVLPTSHALIFFSLWWVRFLFLEAQRCLPSEPALISRLGQLRNAMCHTL